MVQFFLILIQRFIIKNCLKNNNNQTTGRNESIQ
jgi:hypothetical protein